MTRDCPVARGLTASALKNGMKRGLDGGVGQSYLLRCAKTASQNSERIFVLIHTVSASGLARRNAFRRSSPCILGPQQQAASQEVPNVLLVFLAELGHQDFEKISIFFFQDGFPCLELDKLSHDFELPRAVGELAQLS